MGKDSDRGIEGDFIDVRQHLRSHATDVRNAADKTKTFLLENKRIYDFHGNYISEKEGQEIAPKFSQHSLFIDGENLNNVRIRALAAGINHITELLADADIVPEERVGQWQTYTDSHLQLFRDLEFFRLRYPEEADTTVTFPNTVEDVRERYYGSQADPKQIDRFLKRYIKPLHDLGLVDTVWRSATRHVISGPVLAAFTDRALIPFLTWVEERQNKLTQPESAPDHD